MDQIKRTINNTDNKVLKVDFNIESYLPDKSMCSSWKQLVRQPLSASTLSMYMNPKMAPFVLGHFKIWMQILGHFEIHLV